MRRRALVAGSLAVEIDVKGYGVSIADGDTLPTSTDGTDFGIVARGATGLVRTFTVTNTGSGVLNTSGLGIFFTGSSSASSVFSIVEGLSATLAAGASDTITIRLNTSTVGTFTRELRFVTNDPNENPYNFFIKGTVTP